jgi:hypothetical protein
MVEMTGISVVAEEVRVAHLSVVLQGRVQVAEGRQAAAVQDNQ